MKKILKQIFYGAVIGASVIVPGLSGGTSALILGIYGDILDAVDRLFSDFKKSFPYLLTLAAGGALGFYVCSFPLGFILKNFAFEFSFFILGVIAGSIPIFFNTPGKKISSPALLLAPCGVLFTFGFEILSARVAGDGPLSFLIVGLLSAIALILPGISLTYVLAAFGCYDALISAINGIELGFLIKLGSATMLGILAFTRILNRAYRKYPAQVNMAVLGMVLASARQVFVRMPSSHELLPCTLLFCGGFALGLAAGRLEKGADGA